MERGKSFLCLFGILISARITLQASSPASTFYIGAAVEYHPVTKGNNGTAIADENVKNYVKFLKKASDHEVDIIVFPEGSLTAGRPPAGATPAEIRSALLPHASFVPDPKDRVAPCKNDSSNVMQALKAISCAAKQYATYVVVNLNEKATCASEKITKDCSPDGHVLYNTNVAFDRQGVIVARYRKTHLFGEAGFDVTPKSELSTFRTDFDVTFGQFICFDILFEKPALRLLTEAKVTDIVTSTHWFSELPFLVSTSVQSSWARAKNVNLIASNYNDPSKGSSGSGIYAGNEGLLAKLWFERRANALVITKIPKVINGRREYRSNPLDSTTYSFTKNEISTIDGDEPVPQLVAANDDLSPYTTKLFSPTNGTHSETLCDRGLCCEFSTDTTHHNALGQNNAKYFRYRFAVFNGVRSYSGKGSGGVEVCGLISCTDDTPASCNRRFDTNEIIVHPLTFNSIVVSGNFTNEVKNVSRIPIAFNTDLQPLNVSDFMWQGGKLNLTHMSLKLSLTKSRTGLMTFAIWGRNFAEDGKPVTRSSAGKSSPFVFVLVMLVILGLGSSEFLNPLANVA